MMRKFNMTHPLSNLIPAKIEEGGVGEAATGRGGKMNYPTIDAVNEADRYQICKWWRFLPSPGSRAFKKSSAEFTKVLEAEAPIMDRIAERFKEMGGFTPEISKSLGWGT